MLRTRLLVTACLVGASRLASAQPTPEPEPPPTAPEPPPPIPTTPPPPADDPVATAMTAQAHSAALRNECERVEMYAYKVRSLSPDTYRRTFATDAAIIACDPRAQRRERAAVDAYHATGLALSVGVAVAKRIDVNSQPIGIPVTLGNNVPSIVPTMRAYVGYQGEVVELGASVAFAHEVTTDNTVVNNVMSFATSNVVIGPSARVRLWHSREARAELLLALDAAVGWAWTTTDPTQPGATSPPSDFIMRVRAGLGLRYWLAPSFAVALVSAVQVDYLENHNVGQNDELDTTNTSVVNQLELQGVF